MPCALLLHSSQSGGRLHARSCPGVAALASGKRSQASLAHSAAPLTASPGSSVRTGW